jgi:4-alpha-glucanotransferase
MERDRILRSWVFQFESTAAQPLPQAPTDCLVTLGTHDLPRFGAYLWGEDIVGRQERGVLSADEATAESRARAQWRERLFAELGLSQSGGNEDKLTAAALEGILLELSAGAADLLMVDLEELWDERAQENVPGSGPGGTNWRLRSTRSLEELEADRQVSSLMDEIARGRRP